VNKILISLLLLVGLVCNAEADNTGKQNVNDKAINLTEQIEKISRENKSLNSQISHLRKEVTILQSKLSSVETKGDSVDNVLKESVFSNKKLVDSNHKAATEQIKAVNETSQSNVHRLTLWGTLAIVFLILAAIVIYTILHRGITKGSDAISAIRAAQGNLEEESVKLDTKLVELLDKQLAYEKEQDKEKMIPSKQAATPNHALALKVADEITRIEKNLSRMDPTVKGYKPLVKAIGRIKDNFMANGYEIVTYLGQPYNEGMRINAEFTIDENLPTGTRTITSVSKPQVHYNGELIQKASVTVSQNI